MSPMTSAELEKAVRETIVSSLKTSGTAPAAAADLAGRAIHDALAGGMPAEKAFMGAVQGALSGLLLLEQDLAEASVLLLKAVNEAAQQANIEPLEAMTWSLTAMAQVAVLGAEEVKYAIRTRLDQSFTDCGSLFMDLCQKAAGPR